MLRWILVLVLTVGFSTAWAQSGPAAVTARAQGTVAELERRVADQTRLRNSLAQKFNEQNENVQRLKQEKPSWRRDRELRDLQPEAHAAGEQANAASRQLEKLQGELLVARRAYARAIDDELASKTAAPQRAKDLAKIRTQLAPFVGGKIHRIMIPEIDESADPEELGEQVAAARKTELELEAQIAGLDAQMKGFESKSGLQDAHNRTKELNERENNNSSKTAPTSGSRDAATAVTTDRPPGSEMLGTFDAIATAGALGEVVDSATLELFQRNYRGNDPKQKLESLKNVRVQVEAKRAKLRADRQKIERAIKR
jgi:hypothetical protein